MSFLLKLKCNMGVRMLSSELSSADRTSFISFRHAPRSADSLTTTFGWSGVRITTSLCHLCIGVSSVSPIFWVKILNLRRRSRAQVLRVQLKRPLLHQNQRTTFNSTKTATNGWSIWRISLTLRMTIYRAHRMLFQRNRCRTIRRFHTVSITKRSPSSIRTTEIWRLN